MKNRATLVSINSVRGRLRLRLPRTIWENRKQEYLYLGLPDNSQNRKLAEIKARQIELDILSGNFDSTLSKYSSKTHESPPAKLNHEEVTLVEIYTKYTNSRKKITSKSTQKGYLVNITKLERSPFKLPSQAINLKDWAIETLPIDTAKRFLMQVNAACNWAVQRSILENNPFSKIDIKLKISKSKNKIYPFTTAEEEVIINAFRDSGSYSDLTYLVKFFFLTGCRTSEALGLQWQHISEDSINFKETVVTGIGGVYRNDKTKSTERYFPCNNQLRKLLTSIKPENYGPETSVFVRADNTPITYCELRNAWYGKGDRLGIVRQLATDLKIEAYRIQYNTRHTFISRCLEAGIAPVQVAAWVGNSPAMIYQHYAGIICKIPVPIF